VCDVTYKNCAAETALHVKHLKTDILNKHKPNKCTGQENKMGKIYIQTTGDEYEAVKST
jgi:hypothetical protein